MNNSKRALFIGRFQPFHLGHLSVLEDISDAGYDEVIIGLGSSQYHGTAENPLTAEQRAELIITTIVESNIDGLECIIVEMPDIHDDDHWVEHVTELARKEVGEFGAIYSGNERTQRLFKADNMDVTPVKFVIKISATEIRQMIATGDDSWESYVHTSIVEDVRSLLTAS